MNCTEIWINEENLIAAFHEIRGYKRNPIENFQKFIYLIQQLVERGYKFE